MMLIDIVRRSGRSLRSAKARTLLTALAIAVGAFALTLTLAASNGAQHYADSIIKDNFDPSELIVTSDPNLFSNTDSSKPQVYDQSFGSVTSDRGNSQQVKMLGDADINKLKQVPGVSSVSPAMTISLQYLTRDGQKKYVATAQAYSSYKHPELLAGSVSDQLADHTVILPEGFVSALGFQSPTDAIGKPIRISVRKQVDQAAVLAALLKGADAGVGNAPESNNSTEEAFTVVAVARKPPTLIQAASGLYLNISPADVTRLNDYVTAGTAGYHKYITTTVKIADGTNAGKLQAAQSRIKALGYSAQSVIDTQKTLTQVINVLQGIVTVFGLIAIVASVFGVINTMYISVLQRTREIGLMKALGMHKKDINKLFLFEAGLIGLLGGALGSVVAIATGLLLNPVISRKLTLGNVHLLAFKPAQVLVLVASLMAVAVIAGLLPARKAARLDPIEALRAE